MKDDAAASKLGDRIDEHKTKLKEFMGENERLTAAGDVIATWRRTEKSHRFVFERPSPAGDDSEFIVGAEKPKTRKLRPSAAEKLGLATEILDAPPGEAAKLDGGAADAGPKYPEDFTG